MNAELEEAYPDRLSLLSGVAGRPGVEAAVEEASPVADFLNMCRSEILPRRRPEAAAAEAEAGVEGSASVPADRGLREEEKDGRPGDLL